ncbi:hypothetical protein [Rahnella laticis]|uniref:hypothetical protein n=1 Tax=Rahnella laticis TaxID=2787622 RepID=UPI0018A26523|nr:hypothetical protein [Rahnella laticis]MBF7995018.1 hypothetical protein [Rahnella laticis]
MSSPSSTAGKACAECGMPEPCLHKIEADFPKQKEKHIWPVENPAQFTLLDDGSGAEGTITVTSKCSKSGCPKAELKETEQNTSVSLKSDGSPNKVKLTYKKAHEVQELMSSPWDYLSSITTPADAFTDSSHYVVVSEGCYQKGQHIYIDVYPAIEMRFTVGLSYDLMSSVRERSIKERRDEQIKSRKAMDDTKTKDNKKLRSGWEYHTDQFELTRKTTLSVEFGVKIANEEFSAKYASEIKKVKTIKSLEQLKRVDKLIDKINTYCAPDPLNSGSTRKYNVFSTQIEPVKIGISYAYQYTDVQDGPLTFMGLYGKPFLAGSFQFDIIQFICAYCKIESLVAKCREYLETHDTSIECYLKLTAGINLNIGAVYKEKNKEWAFEILKENQLKLTIEGVVSAAFEAEVFSVQLTFGAKAAIEASAGFELDPHDKGLDLAAFHDGIKGRFEFIAEIKRGGDEDEAKSQGTSQETKKEWQLADALKACDSPLRINLYGIPRITTKPNITEPNKFQPWAIESNQEWNF